MPLLISHAGRAVPYVEPVSALAPIPFENMLTREIENNSISHQTESKVTLAYHAVQNPIGRTHALVASQLMTVQVQSIFPELSMAEARERMKRHGFKHLPVISRMGELVGILSDRDVLKVETENESTSPVSKYMSKHVLTATPETAIRQIAEAMLTNRIHALPIVDTNQHMIGILTTTDILRAIVERAPIDLWA